MTLRVVVDTNLWIRALLGGRVTLPILAAWQAHKFTVVVSQPLVDELIDVIQRPRLRTRACVLQGGSTARRRPWH